MIQFAPLRTNRLSVDLRELSISDAEALCMLPADLEQAGITAMLEKIVVEEGRPFPGQVVDAGMWTVQERMYVMAHYMAHTTEDDDHNFEIGGGRFADYVLAGTDYTELVSLGEVGGIALVMRPLLGFQAEAIERLIFSGKLRKNRLSWWCAAMGCQILRADEPVVPRMSDSDYGDWLLCRAQHFRDLPESEFIQYLHAFLAGTDALAHLFAIAFTDSCIAAKFKPAEAFSGKEVEGSALARFPVLSAISSEARQVLGVSDQPEG